MSSSIFHGLSAFPITPCDSSGRVDESSLSKVIARLADARVDSIGLIGSTGTYMYLDRAERQRAFEIATNIAGSETPIIVGVGALRTDAAEQFAKDAEQAGASGLLLAPVSYTPLNDEEVFQHYASVAGATGLPLCIYNNPTTTHFTFSVSLIERLSGIDNIVALKNPGAPASEMAAVIKPLRDAVPSDFSVGFSGDWFAANALLAGGDAWYSVAGGLLPVPCLALARAAQSLNQDEVKRIDGLFQPLWDLFKELTSLRVMYAAAEILELTSCKPPRPILPVEKSEYSRIAKALESLPI
ncbi:dihydrodipicolinate synthase family protein [Phyllobacterium sp. YR531]|uniref:dihydrodipicolinate synthase family protein n=1 Tax=Phyllobacterium sp. YR531 TaxID=1144343 RepID=UPI00026F7E95|nr:dihydrodipicolinate synthase family protein [Phyllobacterium sp. YR531]EJN01673.1 dihydrodipicolinate synthase/N-acetylneuraminate lyase [Phyllobacterium sp. YR531]